MQGVFDRNSEITTLRYCLSQFAAMGGRQLKFWWSSWSRCCAGLTGCQGAGRAVAWSGCQGVGAPGPSAGLCGAPGARVWGAPGSGCQAVWCSGCPGVGCPGSRCRAVGYPRVWVPGCVVLQVLDCVVFWVPGCGVSRVRVLDCVVLQVPGCGVPQGVGYPGSGCQAVGCSRCRAVGYPVVWVLGGRVLASPTPSAGH